MKKTYSFNINGRREQREYNYIPVRYIIAIIITVIEVLAVLGIVIALCYYVPYFYVAAWLTEIGCVLRIIASDDNPDYKVPWLLFVLIVPIAGFMLYFLFYSRTLQPRFIKRLNELKRQDYARDDSAWMEALREESPVACGQASMLRKTSGAQLFVNTRQRYFPIGEEMFAAMLEDLKQARDFIFMEYFIIEEGLFWDSILSLLKEKAAQGVEVRVLYDDIGCMSTLPGNYYKQLQSFGIKALPFSRLRGNADSEFNNRSHRKICVIDGKVAYTGGVNIADEYINEVERFGHWKDTGLRLEGEAVWEMTRLFLGDYGINTKKAEEPDARYYPAVEDILEPGYIIPFGDGPKPICQQNVGKIVIQNLLSGATRYAWMTTPYLIIDNDLCTDLENAALRGVDVRIILPHIPDKKLVFAMSRSFYPRLMAAGVKIYEYTPGFIHAKSYLVDDDFAMIGTINMDYRSLVHHFENGVWMFRCKAARDLKADMISTMEKSMPVGENMLKSNVLQKTICAVTRIFAPML